MFAIAMPAYNAAPTLGEAVESVLGQTFESWELVIVDDGSTDRTRSIAEAYAAGDPRIGVIHQANAGCGPARSVAIDNTSAPYIVHFDADDVLLPGCLEAYAEFISTHPRYDIFSCDAEVFGQPGPVARYFDEQRFPGEDRFDSVAEFGLEEMLASNLVLSAAAVFTRDIYWRAGGIRPDAHTEDYDLWLRAMAVGGRHIYLPEVLARYRVAPSQMTASVERTLDGTAESLQHLAASGVLDLRLRRLALKRAAALRRTTCEMRLCSGDLRGARSGFLGGRLAYESIVKFALGLPVVMLSPRLYASVLRWRRHAS
jgi:Glycosyl transferase family 2